MTQEPINWKYKTALMNEIVLPVFGLYFRCSRIENFRVLHSCTK